jgi:PKD repeat protein
VDVNPRRPEAAFTFSPQTNITTATQVQFNDTSTGGQPDTWSWNFGDGTAPSGERNPVHRFPRAGTFQVTLTVVNRGGQTTSSPQTVRVTDPRPTASFTVGATRLVGQPVSFNSGGSTGTGLAYTWNFGDGSAPDTRANPSHTFAAAREYTVTLVVRNGGGDSAPFTQTVRIYPVPTASVTAPSGEIRTGTAVTFRSNTTGDDGPSSITWQVDGHEVGTGATLQYTFAEDGPHDVTVRARNAGGGDVTSAPVRVTVLPTKPQAVCKATHGSANGEIVLDGRDSVGSQLTYSWNFDDGGTAADSTSPNPTHTFAGDRPHKVVLTVSNAGGSDTCEVDIPARPVAEFDSSPAVVTTATTVTFTSTSTGTDLTYAWNFDDGSPVDTRERPTHRFTTANTYDVTLVVSNLWGSSTAVTHRITVVL